MSGRMGVRFAAAVAILAVGAVSGANGEEHKALYRAHYELKEAKAELKGAAHDFGGHRVKALEAVDAAIRQVDVCLKELGEKVGKYEGAGEKIYKKYENHPHIRHAVIELRAARTEMKEAKHDFGGHRERAIKDIDYAVEQLEVCLKFAK